MLLRFMAHGREQEMTMSIFNLVVRSELSDAASRAAGRQLRDKIIVELARVDVAEIDLEGVSLTPSFADELIGGLWSHFGDAAFRRRVRVTSLTAAHRALLNHVLSRRKSDDSGAKNGVNLARAEHA